ncbi:hypothetical protein [Dysgonomonas sp. 520]|uniref:hypothetical protein n=1 Tax=Dysgonomonas sp. 520 TaxID=2302931 RepID=UPI0013D39200|nr:hypothetical protein [Dysgonomonas sp. 520]NDW08464.1 hypothetical protein [Dysgonomonas sp. 520]
MPQTKFEIFRVAITDTTKLSFDSTARKKIDNFLKNPNYIYINHTASIATEDIEKYGVNKTTNKFLIVTLVYKDLTETEYNLSNTGRKTKKIVHQQIKNGDSIQAPVIETSFDTKIKKSLDENRLARIIANHQLIINPEDLDSVKKNQDPNLIIINDSPDNYTVFLTYNLSDEEKEFLKMMGFPTKKKK